MEDRTFWKKKCCGCGEIKNVSEFKIDKNGKYKKCIGCYPLKKIKEIKKEDDKEIKDIHFISLKNKQRRNESSKKYNLEHTNELKEYRKNYYKKNKEKLKKYIADNKEKIKNYQKEYIKSGYHKKYIKEKRKNNPDFKLSQNIKSLIYAVIRKSGYIKNSKTFNILGCSFDEFKSYIKDKFEPWMNENNQGRYTGNYNETWQLDHIIPISSGMTEEEIIKLNHYSNFRPLCSRKNLEKGKKLIYN